MERESLLALLVIVLGGLSLHLCSPWLLPEGQRSNAIRLERAKWLQLWLPVVPGLLGWAWLCGWALGQPDPVPAHTVARIVVLCVPFVLIGARAGMRAGWSLRRSYAASGAVTVGLLRPRVRIAPAFSGILDPGALAAALEHERAHARHYDPLRIWLAQVITDLQWPWPQAQQRLTSWLVALELARDAEARAHGASGEALASAILASLRFSAGTVSTASAALAGEQAALKERIGALLMPFDEQPSQRGLAVPGPWLLLPMLLVAALVGALFGGALLNPLLGIPS